MIEIAVVGSSTVITRQIVEIERLLSACNLVTHKRERVPNPWIVEDNVLLLGCVHLVVGSDGADMFEKIAQDLFLKEVVALPGVYTSCPEHSKQKNATAESIDCKKARQLFNTLFGCGNDLSEASHRQLEEHMNRCDECRARYEQLKEYQ